MADHYSNTFQYDSAIHYHEKLYNIALENEDWPAYVMHLNETANNYVNGHAELAKAKDMHERALEIARAKLDTFYPELANAYINVALFDQDNPQRSLNYLFKALKIRQKVYGEESEQVAFVYDRIGMAYGWKEQMDKMEKYVNKGLRIRLCIFGENHAKVGYSYNSLAWMYESLADYEKHMEYLEKALQIFKQDEANNPGPLTLIYLNMGFHYVQKENYQEAMTYFKEGYKLAVNTLGKKHSRTFLFQTFMARVMSRIGQTEAALQYYLDLRDLYYGKDNDKGVWGLLGICEKYYLLGNYDEALCYAMLYEEDQRRNSESELRKLYRTSNHLGKIYLRLGEYKKALERFSIALDMGIKRLGRCRHPEIAEVQMGIGECYLKLGRYENALAYYQEAVINMTAAFDEGDYFINPGEDEEISNPLIYVSALSGKADALLKFSGHVEPDRKKQVLLAALNTFQKALNINYELLHSSNLVNERQTLLSASIPLYQKSVKTAFALYELTGEKRYLEECFNVAERSKSNLLLQNLKEDLAKQKMLIPEEVKALEIRLRSDVDFYKKRLFDARQKGNTDQIALFEKYIFDKSKELMSLRKKLEETYPEYKMLKQRPVIHSLAEIREALLDSLTTLVEYFDGGDVLFVFVLNKNTYQVFELQNRESLFEQADEFLTLVKQPPGKEELTTDAVAKYQQLAFKLYHHLLEVPLNDVPSTERLLIIPDRLLSFLPFEALVTNNKTKGKSYRSLPYLVNRSKISYGYSASFLLARNRTRRTENNGECLAMAPGYPGTNSGYREYGTMRSLRGASLEKLPGAQKEARIVAEYFEGTFLFGKEATESNFKRRAGNYGVIHLSMHSSANELDPLYSSMFFSRNSEVQDDDTLYSYELNDLNVNADLVVLSACETGKGEFVKGEGVMSFARNFLNAGSKSVVQTLWKVEDQSSYQLMQYFYEGLSKANPVDGVLQQSKVSFIKNAYDNHTHPFYWSGYVLNGSAQPLKIKSKRQDFYLYILGVGLILCFTLALVKFRS